MLKSESIIVSDMPLTITEINAKATIALSDARTDGASDTEVAAIICHHCVVEWRDKSMDELLLETTPNQLGEVVKRILTLSGVNEEQDPNSNPGPRVSSLSG